MLKCTRNLLGTEAKKCIYFAHIYSHLVYGCTTWGNMLNRSQIKKLQKIQNKCIACIINRCPKRNDYQSLKILKIDDVVKLQNLKLGFKLQHSQLPKNYSLHVTLIIETIVSKKHMAITQDRKPKITYHHSVHVSTKTVT